MNLALPVSFRPVDWPTLVAYLTTQVAVAHNDIDHDVRRLTFDIFKMAEVTEGLYIGEELVGFALWDQHNGHLRNLYVSPVARGRGVASKFLTERPLRSLQVMPSNNSAIDLYTKHGFEMTDVVIPNRKFMWRPAVQAAA